MSLSSDRARFRLPGPTFAGPHLIPATLASVVAHAALALLLIGGIFQFAKKFPAPPDQPAEVQIVIGTNARKSGPGGAPPPPPSESTTAQAASTAPPPAPAQTNPRQPASSPPPVPAPTDPTATAPAAPRPPPRRAAQPPAKPTPPPPPPRPTQPAQAQPPPAQAAPTPPPTPAPRPSQSPEDVRLGEGIAGTYAEIGKAGSVRPAERETGNRAPGYPSSAARRHEQGSVLLRIYIDVVGDVSRVDVLRSSGFRDLDDSARDQIMTWHFRPAIKNGAPVQDIEEQEINFSIE